MHLPLRNHAVPSWRGVVAGALIGIVLLTASVATAHPEEFADRVFSRAELARREHLATKRHLAARSCSSSINAFHTSRRAKRSFSDQFVFSEDNLRESTCVTAPEVEEGPYYVNNELVRTDLVEDQEGVIITLDIGVIDTSTCEPVSNALVEIWSANATGFYGSFETKSIGNHPPGRGPGNDPNILPGHPPGRPGRKPGPGGRPPGSPSMTSNNTWLRGGSPTSSNGTTSLKTLFPGFYPGRTIHIHLMIHTDNWSQSPTNNGTFLSQSGKLRHVGQLFFAESWNDRVLEREPYVLNEARRTRNEEDWDFKRASKDRSSAIVEVEMLGESLDDGLVGFITIGIDMTAEYTIHSSNYYNGSSEADSETYSNVADVDI